MNTLMTRVALGVALTVMPASALSQVESTALVSAAKELEFDIGRKTVTGAKVESKLRPAIVIALNDWAPLARELGLNVVVCEEADCILLGTVDRKSLREPAKSIDEAHELFADLLAAAAERDYERLPEPRAAVGFLFDREGFGSDAWDVILDELADRRFLMESTAEQYKRDPGPLALRRDLVFLQSTDDLAGDAGAGDDEFRLENEVAHKYTQALVRQHFGQVPEALRYGMGYVAEQRVHGDIYTFNMSGFVSTDHHFGWPKKVADFTKDVSKDWTPTKALLDETASGLAEPSQMFAWATLDYLNSKEPELLCDMLTRLADAHADNDPQDRAMSYNGDEDETVAILDECCADITAKTLGKHIKRVR